MLLNHPNSSSTVATSLGPSDYRATQNFYLFIDCVSKNVGSLLMKHHNVFWLHEDFLLCDLGEGFKRQWKAQKFSEANQSSNEEEGQLSVTGMNYLSMMPMNSTNTLGGFNQLKPY